MKIKYLVFVFALFLLACKAESQEVETEKEDLQLIKREKRDLYLDITNGNMALDKTIGDDVCLESRILQNIVSPLEIALLTKKSIKKIDTSNLCPITNNYTTNNQKALAIGLYSTAIGYCNLYNLEKEQTEYLYAIGKLANDLQIAKHIHYGKVPNKISFDSLLNFAQLNYERITENEKTMQQSYESYLMLLGGFIEANYQTLLLYEKLQENKTDTTILNQWKEKIGEQKISLEKFVFQCSFFIPFYKEKHIQNDIKALENIYKDVEVFTKLGKANVIVKNGEYLVESNIITIVTISDTTLSKISEKTKEIRSKIIK